MTADPIIADYRPEHYRFARTSTPAEWESRIPPLPESWGRVLLNSAGFLLFLAAVYFGVMHG